MSMHHVGRCDRGECGSEKPLKPYYSNTQWTQQGYGPSTGAPTSYSPPDGWLQIDGKDFCSWQCVALYATSKKASK